MKDSVKRERHEKLTATTRAGIEHLERGLKALEDANLYTNDEQERRIDALIADLELLIARLKGRMD